MRLSGTLLLLLAATLTTSSYTYAQDPSAGVACCRSLAAKTEILGKVLSMCRHVVVLWWALSILAPAVAWSQEPATREEADRQRREQQGKEVKPFEPTGLKKAMDFAETRAIFLLDREAFTRSSVP